MHCPPPNGKKDISRFSKLGVIFLSGDFNARTGELMDYVCNDSQYKYIQNSNDCSVHISNHNILRCNRDNKINIRG